MFKKASSPFTDDSTIEAEGQKDGERNIPDMSSYQPAQFEQALVAYGEQTVQRVFAKASERIAKFQPAFQACKRRLEDLEGRHKAVGNQFKARKSELGRDFAGRFPHRYHIALIIFLGVGEFPLNTIVFRLFGEPEFLTYVMASTLAITIPLLGLFIGVHLRHSFPLAAGNILIGIMIPGSAGAALYAISSMRNTYIVSQATEAGAMLSGSQDELAFALFSINALVFCGALVSSFFAHDPDEQLDRSHRDLVILDRKALAARKRKLTLGTKINGELQRAKSRVDGARALSSQRVALYRRTNVRARSLLPPPSFRKDPAFPSLDWWPQVSVETGAGQT